MSQINFPIPQEKISECFAWRDWFQKLSNAVFGSMSKQDSSNVNISGGTITGVSIPVSSVSGIGTIATQNSNNVNITGGSVTATIGMLNTTATTATIGTHGAPPAQVEGYVIVNIGGTDYKIPYYKT